MTAANADVVRPARGLAFGCSKFGSIVNGVDEAAARRLLDAAVSNGVAHFDTADIYGQGESERILGRLLRNQRSTTFVATKIGQRFPFWVRLLQPLKAPLVAVLARGSGGKSGLQKMRGKPLPRCYRPEYVTKAVASSLRRLGRDHVDCVYLHSPGAPDLADGSAVGALERLRERGALSLVGVSADDIESANAALADPRVTALQIPYLPTESGWADLLAEASRRDVAVAVRSLFSGAGRSLTEDERRALVAAASGDPAIRTIIIGTSSERHLAQVASWAENAGPATVS